MKKELHSSSAVSMVRQPGLLADPVSHIYSDEVMLGSVSSLDCGEINRFDENENELKKSIIRLMGVASNKTAPDINGSARTGHGRRKAVFLL